MFYHFANSCTIFSVTHSQHKRMCSECLAVQLFWGTSKVNGLTVQCNTAINGSSWTAPK